MVKGITNFEFVLSVFVFLSTMAFVAVSIINEVPGLHDKATEDIIKSKTYYTSQMLMFDKGYPQNWTAGTVERLGLSIGSPYILNQTKITELGILCSNTDRLRQLINGDIIINITGQNGASLLYCKTANLPQQLTIKRTAVRNTDMNILKIELVSS